MSEPADRRTGQSGQGKSVWLCSYRACAVVLAMALILAGCRSLNPLPTFGVGGASPEEVRLRKLLKWHSGRTEVYQEFRTVFTARAAFISDEIRRSALEFDAKSRLLTPEEREEMEAGLAGEEGSLRVLVGFYTPEEELNDLAGEDAPWIPYIVGPEDTVERASCFAVEDEEGRIYMRFLEWDLSWSRLYMLCFPDKPEFRQGDVGWITFGISGSGGRGEIRLRTAPPGDAQ